MFLTISLDDDRVPYYIPLQWLAKQRKMQEADQCENSRIIAKIHDHGGHFGSTPGESIKQVFMFLMKLDLVIIAKFRL